MPVPTNWEMCRKKDLGRRTASADFLVNEAVLIPYKVSLVSRENTTHFPPHFSNSSWLFLLQPEGHSNCLGMCWRKLLPTAISTITLGAGACEAEAAGLVAAMFLVAKEDYKREPEH